MEKFDLKAEKKSLIFFKIISFVFLSVFGIKLLNAQVEFADLDLNSNSGLLYTAKISSPGTPDFKTLFLSELEGDSEKLKILTCFPERMELLNDGKILQVRNRFGTAFYSPLTGSLEWASSAQKIPLLYSKAEMQSVSPDGKWICALEKTSAARASLVLKDSSGKRAVELCMDSPFSYSVINAKWSPDSKTLLYEKDGSVYFTKPDALFYGVSLAESYCKIGDGSISSVEWDSDGNIIYISGDIVYLIQSSELFTRALYSKVLGSGKIIGRLPQLFNSTCDVFSSSNGGLELVVTKNSKTAYWYKANVTQIKGYSFTNGCEYYVTKGCYPLTESAGLVCSSNVFWTQTENASPVLWLNILEYESLDKKSLAYVLGSTPALVVDAACSSKPSLSPDGKHIAFSCDEGLFVYSTLSWKAEASLPGEKIISFVWNGSSSIYAGGTETVRLWDLKTNSYIPLFLSSVQSVRWNSGKVYAFVNGEKSQEGFVYDFARGVWNGVQKSLSEFSLPREGNGYYRVYLEDSENPFFKNSIFVRSLSSPVKTYALYKESLNAARAAKKAHIVFDAQDNAEGLATVLAFLNDYNLKGTFFINGEFIRRYPKETKRIALSGSTCASMFFCNTNLLDDSFALDSDFIKRGLARNEDEFFAATGKELSLLWHAPYYQSDSMMKSAGEQAGYSYVESVPSFTDRLTYSKALQDGARYKSAGELLDELSSSLYDGIVVSVNVGSLEEGGRSDYLYQKLDLLVALLVEQGYSVTGLSSKGQP